jgi:hypothetical protein
MARRARMSTDKPVLHAIRIDDWNFDCSFGVDTSPASTKLYYDSRQLAAAFMLRRMASGASLA